MRTPARLLAVLATTMLALLVLVPPAQAAPPAIPSEATARSQRGALTVAATGTTSGYSRDRFPHWIGAGDGCDVRDRVLQRDGTNIATGAGCTVTGRWYSPYDGVTRTSAADIQIDHIVPLAEAWRSGANTWTESRRQSFANDLSGPALIAVNGSVNSAKGDQPPNFWRPPLESYWCTYARMWVGTKSRWALRVTSGERNALYSMLDRC
jgi:hypothetical protein